MHSYFSILKKLRQHGVHYVAIGTWALKLGYPEIMGDYQLSDCDVVIKRELSQIRRAIKVLKKDGWRVSVWEEEVDEWVGDFFLVGKYYLRAKKQGLTLDITYESVVFSWEELQRQRVESEGYFLGSLAHILALKKAKGSAKDLQTIGLFDQNKIL